MSNVMTAPDSAAAQALMQTLIEVSRLYGGDPEFVIAGGGNTSVKIGDRLFVKGSGSSLATIDASGFVEMDRGQLDDLLSADLGADVDAREEAYKQRILAARLRPELGQRPSVECVLHNLLPRSFVVHTHATVVNMLTCTKNGEALAGELFGDDVVWIPYVDPGFILAKTLHDALTAWQRATGRECPLAVFMANHGLIICGESAEEIHEATRQVLEKIRARLAQSTVKHPFGAVTAMPREQARELINVIGPALRGLMAGQDADATLKVVTFDDGEAVLELAGGAEGRAAAAGGPLIPDQIVYCKSFPMWFEPVAGEAPEATVVRLREAIASHARETHFPPYAVLVQGVGLFAIADTWAGADVVRQVYLDAIKIMAGARRLNGVNYMTERERLFIEHWEAEAYRRKVAAGAGGRGRAQGKVALITGAAQGFGLEIAQHLAAQGAHVVLTDINVAGAEAAAAALVEKLGAGRAIGVAINVTSPDSIADAVHQAVRAYGGCDLFVANAGVLKAASVKTQTEKDFDFVTDVNYKGYFFCVQKIAPVMAIQHRARPEAWSDIIQINSKSGLQGSNKNGSYAGSKFGGIGLTQSFAMELVEDGIKVNSICPGNFFDGPLWSDPKNGLFVQYLGTGKVPGAKTIADVKKFYEDKVPMKRGCATADVMKAIYYLMDQLYETGQAIPVTGGQVMLK